MSEDAEGEVHKSLVVSKIFDGCLFTISDLIGDVAVPSVAEIVCSVVE